MRTLFAGIVVYSVVWFFKLRKSEVKRSDVQPSGGDTAYDSKAIDRDEKLSNLEEKIKTIEKKRDEKTKKK